MTSSVSILVSTKNRAPLLRRMLNSLGCMVIPAGVNAELYVIDNGSSDSTPDLLNGYGATLANGLQLKVITVTRPGKSLALNLAMSRAEGQIFAFIDDDVQVSKLWLVELLRGFEDKSVDALQGGVELVMPEAKAWWLTPRVQAICAATSLHLPDSPVTSLNGSNMAVRNDGKLPIFCEQIGPGMTPYSMGEDAEWSARLLSTEHRKGKFCPKALVYHDLDARLRFSEVIARQIHSGKNRLVFAPSNQRWSLVWEALWQLPYSCAKALIRFGSGQRLRALDNLLDAARYFGILHGPVTGIHLHPCWNSLQTSRLQK